MLFNSPTFLFVFLPITLAGFALAGRIGHAWALLWLAGLSVAFYAGNGVAHTLLLLGSIAVNYGLGQHLATHGRSRWLAVGVAGNLALLGWFKYAGFATAALPIGISFYTFTQIAWLVDAAAGRAGRTGPRDYLLFVTWFPHLVAGPLLHHGATVPQFRDPAMVRFTHQGIATGAMLFLTGLFKKVVLADSVAPVADGLFAAGQPAGAFAAWAGVVAYTLQIYFDFSGYSDMALGLSRLFNVRLPVNFDSPYQARSIVDFWRRWHISLSSFLRDYVYIPLGGNRLGRRRRYANLLATMLLAGLWHGAGWTFVAWGAWHGVLLVGNHLWSERFPGPPRFPGLAWAGTLLAVMLGWVLFRAPDFVTALQVYAGMAGLHGAGIVPERSTLAILAVLAGIALVLPNIGRMLRDEAPALSLRWQPGAIWATAGFAMLVGVLLRMGRASPFLYAQF